MGFCPLSEASRPRARSKGHVAAGTPLGRALFESHDELARTVRYNYRASFTQFTDSLIVRNGWPSDTD